MTFFLGFICKSETKRLYLPHLLQRFRHLRNRLEVGRILHQPLLVFSPAFPIFFSFLSIPFHSIPLLFPSHSFPFLSFPFPFAFPFPFPFPFPISFLLSSPPFLPAFPPFPSRSLPFFSLSPPSSSRFFLKN